MSLLTRSALALAAALVASATAVAWTPAALEGPGVQTGEACVELGSKSCVEAACVRRGQLRIEIAPATDRLSLRWTPTSPDVVGGSCTILLAYYVLSLECSEASGGVACSHVDAYGRHSLSVSPEGVARFFWSTSYGYGESSSEVRALVRQA